jgi:ATP-dependent protease ClpP protease subunit
MEIAPIEVHEQFSEEIWPWSGEALLAKMTEHAYLGVEHVVLDVSSLGGEVASAMSVYQALRSSPFELVTRNMGEVASMGNLVFLAGERRLAIAEATFLLHPITVEAPAEWPTSARWLDVEDMRKLRTKVERSGASPKLFNELDWGIMRLAREEREVQRIFEERTSLTGPQFRKLVRGHTTVSAAYACAVGIVHEVISVPG